MEEMTLGVKNLRCTIARVRFQRETFAICECETTDEIPTEAIIFFMPWGEEPNLRRFVALGDGLSVRVGQKVTLSGNWEKNPKREGEIQLRTLFCSDYVGESENEIISYLSSSVLKGVGEKTARNIYDMFGKDSLRVIAEEPDRLLAVSGIKKKKLQKLVDSYQKNQALHALTMMLAQYKVPYPTIVRIYRRLGVSAVATIKNNPYELCSVRGFGYMTADELALNMGFSSQSRHRIASALSYVLKEIQTSDGHLFLPKSTLVGRTLKTLNTGKAEPVMAATVEEVILEEIGVGKLKVLKLAGDAPDADPRIYSQSSYQAEYEGARGLRKLISSASEQPTRDHDELIELVKEVQEELEVTLDSLQEQAVLMCMENPLSIITGGPGTGKTTTLNVLVQAEIQWGQNQYGHDPTICLAAPTGRAARRMTEQTGMEAATLHSLLGLQPDSYTDFSTDLMEEDSPLYSAVMLVVDESSMIDAQLMAELMYRIPSGLRVVFVGDADQLPSVGPGNVLAQMLSMEEIPHVKLEKVFRQGAGSIIPVNSQRIKNGDVNLSFNRYFKLIECASEEEGAQVIRSLAKQAVSKGMADSVQILAPMRNRGEVCTKKLNAMLQDIVNPVSPEKAQESIGGVIYRKGDRVMQTRNIGEVSNGDMGVIKDIRPIQDGDKDSFSMTVSFQEGAVEVEYDYADALDVVPALAVTIHKSQGSEFPFIIIPIFKSMNFFLQRNLLYTAVTRAKIQVALVGQIEAIYAAIRKINSTRRNTSLASLVREHL